MYFSNIELFLKKIINITFEQSSPSTSCYYRTKRKGIIIHCFYHMSDFTNDAEAQINELKTELKK